MSTMRYANRSEGVALQIPVGSTYLSARLNLTENPRGLVIIANGDGDHLYDETNGYVARHLATEGFATLVVDLLTPREAAEDAETSELRFHQSLLASRLVRVTQWMRGRPAMRDVEIGFFASGLCAGAALAAASVVDHVRAVVCRGARVDLVVPQLHSVRAQVLLLVGERDTAHIAASRGAFWLLPDSARLEVVPNAGHLLDDPIALDRVADEAERWFGETLDTCPAAVEAIDGMLAGVP
jgi:putative phosphoribosyl transferase